MLLLVSFVHICFNTRFPFCECIYLKHKHRKYAPQRLSRNNSCQIMLRTDFVRNGHHWNWADCYGREESIRCKNSSRAYIRTRVDLWDYYRIMPFTKIFVLRTRKGTIWQTRRQKLISYGAKCNEKRNILQNWVA